ncbi:MAG TPA: prolyl oligopeptidase family serine peptidase, partial [Fimbriimonas sp.]|nr:prolyl oligopeptidase family serine peptidase [Fimbriimonas sp.]
RREDRPGAVPSRERGVQLKRGVNKFLFAVGRGSFSGKLVDVTKPISLDARDLTSPDIILGEKETLYAALIVRNAERQDADNLSISCGGVTTKLGRVLGSSVRKVGFQLKPNATGKYTVELKRGGKTIDSLPLTLRKRSKRESHKRTFVSKVDGSVQYYAVQPSTSDEPGQALFLSLHGASVEAQGQAESYSPKSWGYIVCPTNRRPFGFNWEDIGRLDALEVFELAKKQYKTDPTRSYLTGHSMGGHGTYHLGVLYPDKFAALAPCSGWVSYFSYANGATYPATPEGDALRRAMGASDTLSMKTNTYTRPVFLMHGDADDNVPVTEPRNFRKENPDHPMLFWHEEKGQGHWFDTDPEPGANCQDFAPIYDLFARTRLPLNTEVRDVHFRTPNLAMANSSYWVTITSQVKTGEISEAKGTVYPGLRKFVIATTNVAAMSLDTTVLNGSGEFTVEVNGRKVSAELQPNGMARVALVAAPNYSHSTLTGFKSVFNDRVTFIIPSEASETVLKWARSKARYDAEQLGYIGNGSADIITDKEFLANPDLYGKRNILAYGDSRNNKASALLGDAERQIPGHITLQAGAVNGRVVARIFGASDEDYKYTDRVPLFTAGAALPDVLVLRTTYLREGMAGVASARFVGE